MRADAKAQVRGTVPVAAVPAAAKALIPRHIAIVMDGNGRWAKKRFMPRVVGHGQGVDTLVRTVLACVERGG